MANHWNILAWEIPWTEESGGLQSTGSQSWTQLSTNPHMVSIFPCDFTVCAFSDLTIYFPKPQFINWNFKAAKNLKSYSPSVLELLLTNDQERVLLLSVLQPFQPHPTPAHPPRGPWFVLHALSKRRFTQACASGSRASGQNQSRTLTPTTGTQWHPQRHGLRCSAQKADFFRNLLSESKMAWHSGDAFWITKTCE